MHTHHAEATESDMRPNTTTNRTNDNNDSNGATPFTKRTSAMTESMGTIPQVFSYGESTVNNNSGSSTKLAWRKTLYYYFPILKSLRRYDCKNNLLSDILAGCAVGTMVVPTSMSYAKLAGLPVEFGLYSSLVPVLAYAVWGSSRHLIVGPLALTSLMLNSGLDLICKPMDEYGYVNQAKQEQYNIYAMQVGLLVGAIYLLLGIFRLGFITVFLSHAVISGFTTGAAIIIALSQLKYFFGYSIERSDVAHDIIYNLYAGISKFNYQTFVLGTICVVILVNMNNIGNERPELKWMKPLGPLVVTVLTILIATFLDLDLPVVGDIPSGLPSFTGNVLVPINNFGYILQLATAIAAVGLTEAIAISKQLATRHNYQLDSTRELLAQGMANALGSMFSGYPVCGAFCKSAVNNDAGATSQISGIVSVVIVGLVLGFMNAWFENLPLCTLAAIIISAVNTLIEFDEARFLWRIHKLDFIVWTFSCVGTLFLGVNYGLGVSVELSFLFVVYELAYPKPAMLGRIPGTTSFSKLNYDNFEDSSNIDERILLVRLAAPMFFSNVQLLREHLQECENKALIRAELYTSEDIDSQMTPSNILRYIILDLSAVSAMDASGISFVRSLQKQYKEREIQLCLSGVDDNVLELLKTANVIARIGSQHIFMDNHDAVESCTSNLGMEYRSMAA